MTLRRLLPALGLFALLAASPRRALASPPRTQLELGVGAGLGGRWLDYHDALTPTLRDYALFGAPSLAVEAAAFPLATTRPPWCWLRDLGVRARYEGAVGVLSDAADASRVRTSWTAWSLALQQRVVGGCRARPVIVRVDAGVSGSSFTFDAPPAALASALPETTHVVLRLGAQLDAPLGPLRARLRGAALPPLSEGGVADRFRAPTVFGVALGAGLAAAVGADVELGLDVDYERYFYAFSPIPGDPEVAGGALEQTLRLGLSARWRREVGP